MAMILYFKDVERMPPVFDTHWDFEKQPVRVKPEPID